MAKLTKTRFDAAFSTGTRADRLAVTEEMKAALTELVILGSTGATPADVRIIHFCKWAMARANDLDLQMTHTAQAVDSAAACGDGALGAAFLEHFKAIALDDLKLLGSILYRFMPPVEGRYVPSGSASIFKKHPSLSHRDAGWRWPFNRQAQGNAKLAEALFGPAPHAEPHL